MENEREREREKERDGWEDFGRSTIIKKH